MLPLPDRGLLDLFVYCLEELPDHQVGPRLHEALADPRDLAPHLRFARVVQSGPVGAVPRREREIAVTADEADAAFGRELEGVGVRAGSR